MTNTVLFSGELEYNERLCFGVVTCDSLSLYQTVVTKEPSCEDSTVETENRSKAITYWRRNLETHKCQASFLLEIDLRNSTIVNYDNVREVLVLHSQNAFHHVRFMDHDESWRIAIKKAVAFNHNRKLIVPDELLLQIMQFMTAKELCSTMSIISSHLNQLSYNELLWRSLYQERWCNAVHLDVNYFRQLLSTPNMTWYQIFKYRYTTELIIYRKKQAELNECKSTEDLSTEDYGDDVEMNYDLPRFELSNDDAIQICEMIEAIKPEQQPSAPEDLVSRDRREVKELSKPLHFQKQLLTLCTANIFEESFYQNVTKIYMIRNYSIMLKKLSILCSESTNEEATMYIRTKIRYIDEQFQQILSIQDYRQMSKELAEMSHSKWRGEIINEYISSLIMLIADFPDNNDKRLCLELTEIKTDNIFDDKSDVGYKILKANLIGRRAKLLQDYNDQHKLFDEAIHLLDSCRRVARNSSTLCSVGNAIFDKLNLLLKRYRQVPSEEEKMKLQPQIHATFNKTKEAYEQLGLLHRCEGLSYYNRACLHAICHGITFLGIDHEAEAKYFLQQTHSFNYGMSGIDDDPDFDLIREETWFKELRRNMVATNSTPAQSTVDNRKWLAVNTVEKCESTHYEYVVV